MTFGVCQSSNFSRFCVQIGQATSLQSLVQKITRGRPEAPAAAQEKLRDADVTDVTDWGRLEMHGDKWI